MSAAASAAAAGGGMRTLLTIVWILCSFCFPSLNAVSTTTTSSTTLSTTPASANIRQPPSVIVGPNSYLSFQTGGSVALPCGATGTPTPTYSWLKNGVKLNLNQGNIIQGSGGSITISPATSTDAANYQCTANNQWGTSVSNISFVQMATLGSFPTDQPIYSSQPTTGNKLAIACQEQPSSVPTATFTWEITTKDGLTSMAVAVSDRIQIDPTGTLHFANVIAADSTTGNYMYICYVLNPQLATRVGGSYTQVTVSGANVFNGPSRAFFSQSPTTALIGESISLTCLYAGNPTPNITWTSSTGATIPSERFVLSNFNTVLTINGVEEADEGTYTCRGSNNISSAAFQNDVNVQQAPTFTSINDTVVGSLVDTNATDGESVDFVCDTDANPIPTIVWYRNGAPLNPSSLPTKYSLSEDKTTLTVSDICKECADGTSDLTVVQCNVSNKHGFLFGQGYLNVLLPTLITSVPSNMTVDGGTQMVLTCAATSDPSTPINITWSFNGEDRVFEDTAEASWETASVQTSDQGVYTCTVSNSYSNSSADVFVTVTPQVVTTAADVWWVFLIIGLLLLLILLFLFLIFYKRHNVGESYPVDEEEKKNGNDPVTDLKNQEFQDFQRTEGVPRTAAATAATFNTFKVAADGAASHNADYSSSSNLLGAGLRYKNDDVTSFGDPYQPEYNRPAQIVIVGAGAAQGLPPAVGQQYGGYPIGGQPRGNLDAAFDDGSSSTTATTAERLDDFIVDRPAPPAVGNYPGSQSGLVDNSRSYQPQQLHAPYSPHSNAVPAAIGRMTPDLQPQYAVPTRNQFSPGYQNVNGGTGVLLDPRGLPYDRDPAFHPDDQGWNHHDGGRRTPGGSVGHGVVLSPGTPGAGLVDDPRYPPPRQSMLRGYSVDDGQQRQQQAVYDDPYRVDAYAPYPTHGIETYGDDDYDNYDRPSYPVAAAVRQISRESMRNADESSV